jgi:hypothetical protein
MAQSRRGKPSTALLQYPEISQPAAGKIAALCLTPHIKLRIATFEVGMPDFVGGRQEIAL